MPDVVIYGASDDLIEVEGTVPGCDEYNAEKAAFVLTGKNGASTRVVVFYTPDGVWAITAAPLDEDTLMLPLSIIGDRYTARALVAGVKRVEREDGAS